MLNIDDIGAIVIGACVGIIIGLLAATTVYAEDDSTQFCRQVATISTELAWEPPDQRVKALSALKEWKPMLAYHVIPATSAAVKYKNNGYSKEFIAMGILRGCRAQVEES